MPEVKELHVEPIELKTITPRNVVTIRETIPMDAIAQTLGRIYGKVAAYLERIGVQPDGPPFSRYFSMTDDGVDLDAGFPVAAPISGEGQIAASELPGGEAAVTWHIGPYDTLPQTYNAIMDWMRENDREAGGACWEIYWTDPTPDSNPAEWRTEIIWPVQ